jgi:histidinol dehydrogenase
MKCLKSRKDEIKKTLLEEIVDISSAQLQNFDWQLKLALPSDKIAILQMPLLNIHLDVKENGDAAVVKYEKMFDHASLDSLSVTSEEVAEAEKNDAIAKEFNEVPTIMKKKDKKEISAPEEIANSANNPFKSETSDVETKI